MKCKRCKKEIEPGKEIYTYKGGPPYCEECDAKSKRELRRINSEPWPNQYRDWHDRRGPR